MFRKEILCWYNTETLQIKRFTIKNLVYTLCVIGFVFIGLGFTGAVQFNSLIEKIPVIIRMNEDEFSEDNLRSEIKRLNLKFEDIILAQYRVETGNGSSKIFKENHNLFGMKISKLRPTTAIGENYNHAFYKNWKESVLDYAFWQQQNARGIDSEEEYYKLLEGMYAEDDAYVLRLKKNLK